MSAPLIVVLRNLLSARDGDDPTRTRGWRSPVVSDVQASATVFLVLRRMRAPLIVLILIFAISVLGLSLVPGVDPEGNRAYLGIFDAFYFMSYTATTIGFGELPYPFTDAQRLWVIGSIYLTVIGWAYAIGALLTLLQDRAFRQALALQHFQRKVIRMREPFLLLAGYGQTGEQLARSLDRLGRRLVVLDRSQDRIDALDLAALDADVPGLVADVRNPDHLGVAGLGSGWCEGVLALTDDDEVNLAVTMTAALLRPDLPVVARTVSPTTAERMEAFGAPSVVNPFDRYGDHLRLALRAPASYQLLTWLEAGPGSPLPERGSPPRTGRWVVCGYGRFGRELTGDLRAEGLDVTVIDPAAKEPDEDLLVGDGVHPSVLARAELADAVGFVAGTGEDTTNLSLVAAARSANPDLFVAARQNRPASAPLFHAMDIDSLLVPTEMVAREIYAQLSTPLLWRFLQEMPGRGDAWAAGVVSRLNGGCGTPGELPHLWKVRLTEDEAPALSGWLPEGGARLRDLLRDPDDRDEQLDAVDLRALREAEPHAVAQHGAHLHGVESLLVPGPELLLEPGDQLLLAGSPAARRAMSSTMVVDAVREDVVRGRHVPSSWVWRRLRPG